MKVDRSWHAGIGAPYGWGPGPWDDDYLFLPWRDRAEQFGNLRPWPADISLEGHRVVGETFTTREVKDRVRRMPRHSETVLARCWCGHMDGEVPVTWIREGRTYECDGGCRRRYRPRRRDDERARREPRHLRDHATT